MSIRGHYDAKVGSLWSGAKYSVYKQVDWGWRYLPFHENGSVRRTIDVPPPSARVTAESIVEIGSAMGQGYRFLKESGLVDVSGYVGYDVSKDGQAFCRETYPEAQWIEGDFTTMPLDRTFEYAFERHAIHHMPDPLPQFEKVIGAVKKAACFTFRGRVRGATVSDLEQSYFNHTTGQGYAEGGRVFMNLINVLDVVKIARAHGFNHVGDGVGLHEAIQSEDPERPGMYLAPATRAAGGRVMRFNMFMMKEPTLVQPLLYAYAGQRRCFAVPDFYRLKRELARLS